MQMQFMPSRNGPKVFTARTVNCPFDRPHRDDSLCHPIPKSVAMGYLIETIRCPHRSNRHWLEKEVVSVIHFVSPSIPEEGYSARVVPFHKGVFEHQIDLSDNKVVDSLHQEMAPS
jgi:hypothetical protein